MNIRNVTQTVYIPVDIQMILNANWDLIDAQYELSGDDYTPEIHNRIFPECPIIRNEIVHNGIGNIEAINYYADWSALQEWFEAIELCRHSPSNWMDEVKTIGRQLWASRNEVKL